MPGQFENEFRRARERAMASARRVGVGGDVWLVYELGPLSYDRRGPTLIFESEHAVRRVRDYPASWRELDDEALFQRSERR
jgi:hypothetical protein